MPPKSTPKTPKATAAELAPTDAVTVTGPEKGRRRAGRRFGPEPTVIPAEELAEGELAQLLADPELKVSVVRASAPEGTTT